MENRLSGVAEPRHAMLYGKCQVIECGCGRHFEMAGGKDQLEMGAVVMEGLLGEFRAGNIGQGGAEKGRLKRHLGEVSRRWDEKFPAKSCRRSARPRCRAPS